MHVGAALRGDRWTLPFPGRASQPQLRRAALQTAALASVVTLAATVALSMPEASTRPGPDAATPPSSAATESAPIPGGVELPELRTSTSRTYRGPDGTYTAQLSAQPIHYRTAAGRWEPIDNTLVASFGSLRNRAGSYAVDLPQRLGAQPVRVQKGDDWISFALQGAAPAMAIASGADVRYPSALPGVDVTYVAGAAGVKETLVLTRGGTATSFAFDLQLAAGLTPRVLESGAIGLVDAGGAQRMTLAAPFMVDAAGASSRAVSYTLARRGSGWSLGLAADPKWLAASSRQFPVAVDPTVNVEPELVCNIRKRVFSVIDGDAGGDCESAPFVGVQPNPDLYLLHRPLIRWDLSGIPSDADISRARLNTGAGGFTAYPLTEGFTPSASWDQNGVSSWSTPGGDYDAGSGVTPTSDVTAPYQDHLDLEDIVQDWVDGSRGNEGLILVADDEEAYGQELSLDQLSITYTAAVCPSSDPFAAAQSSSADTVYAWNQILLDVFREQGGAPAPLARAAAMMNVGIYDVLNSVYFAHLEDLSTGTPTSEVCGWEKYLVLADADVGTNADLAAGIAARDILIDAVPGQTGLITSAFNGRHPGVLQPAAVALGSFVADTVIAARDDDGSGDTTPYLWDSVTPGAWRPTDDVGCSSANPSAPATPNWGNVTPFAISSGSQFRQGWPGPGNWPSYASLLASPMYAAQLNEVKDLGRYDSSSRTSDQEEAAWFWANDLDDTYKPPGQLLEHTETVARTQPAAQTTGDPEEFFDTWSQQGIRVSRLFAETSLALADAAIAAWDQKYQWSIDLWRPVTAIQQADTDGNASTGKDANWLPLSANIAGDHFSPCFPAWVSGHATFGGAWSRVMEDEFAHVDFDDPFPLTLTTEDPHSVRDFDDEREFDSFAEAGEENARSRIYLGVHFPFDGTDGLATGRGVADYVTDHYLRPDQTCEAWDCAEVIPGS